MLLVFPGDNFVTKMMSHEPNSDILDFVEKHFSSVPATVYEGLSRIPTERGKGTTFQRW